MLLGALLTLRLHMEQSALRAVKKEPAKLTKAPLVQITGETRIIDYPSPDSVLLVQRGQNRVKVENAMRNFFGSLSWQQLPVFYLSSRYCRNREVGC